MSLGCIVIHRLQSLLANARNFVHETAGIRRRANAQSYCEKLWQVQSWQVRSLSSIWSSSMSNVRFQKPDSYGGVYRQNSFHVRADTLGCRLSLRAFVGAVSSIIFYTHEKIKRIWIYKMELGNKKEEEIFIVFVVLSRHVRRWRCGSRTRWSLTKSNRLEAITTISALQTTDCSRDAFASQCQQQPSTTTPIPTRTQHKRLQNAHYFDVTTNLPKAFIGKEKQKARK